MADWLSRVMSYANQGASPFGALGGGQEAPDDASPYRQGDFQRAGPQMRVTGPLESVKNALDIHKPWGVGETLNAMLMAVPISRAPQNSMARKPYMIYNAPEKPPRPFEADYPAGAPSDAAGNLTKTIEGQPITARHVVGRQVVGGKDAPLPQAEYDALTEATTGRSSQAASPREMGSDLGRIGVNQSSGRPEYILLRSNLPADKVGMVHTHELGHAIDQIAGKIPTTGLVNDFKALYNTLNNPNRAQGGLEAASWGKPMTPKAAGYAGEEIPREFVAEATRAYLQNPNYIKTVAPNVAARIRAYVNAHPELSKIIQFNTLGGLGAVPLMAQDKNDGT